MRRRRADQDRHDQAEPRRLDGALQRDLVAGMGDGGAIGGWRLRRVRSGARISRASRGAARRRASGMGGLLARRARRLDAEQRLDLVQAAASLRRQRAARADHALQRVQRGAARRLIARQQLRDRLDRALFVEAEQQELFLQQRP